MKPVRELQKESKANEPDYRGFSLEYKD